MVRLKKHAAQASSRNNNQTEVLDTTQTATDAFSFYDPDVPRDSIEPVPLQDRLGQPTPSKPDSDSGEAEEAEEGEGDAESDSESLDEEPNTAQRAQMAKKQPRHFSPNSPTVKYRRKKRRMGNTIDQALRNIEGSLKRRSRPEDDC